MSKQQTGQRGEALAQQHIQAAGYEVVATNWRCKKGEIDIVAKQGETLVFIEVRTRQGAAPTAAFESITPAKREKLIQLAYTYMGEQQLSENTLWRIDVIAVSLRRGYKPTIEHAEDALGW